MHKDHANRNKRNTLATSIMVALGFLAGVTGYTYKDMILSTAPADTAQNKCLECSAFGEVDNTSLLHASMMRFLEINKLPAAPVLLVSPPSESEERYVKKVSFSSSFPAPETDICLPSEIDVAKTHTIQPRQAAWSVVKRGDSLNRILKHNTDFTPQERQMLSRSIAKKINRFTLHPGDKLGFVKRKSGGVDVIYKGRYREDWYYISIDKAGLIESKRVLAPQWSEMTLKLPLIEGKTIAATVLKSEIPERIKDSIMMPLEGFESNWIRQSYTDDDYVEVRYIEAEINGVSINDYDVTDFLFSINGFLHHWVSFEYQPGFHGWYDRDGSPIISAKFLRHPVDEPRITSYFNYRRKHPVLGRVRPHVGVDYGMKIGTPIYAVADGKVALAGRNGGYGNTIVINHGEGVTTLYAHQSGFAKGMRAGIHVKKGQLIGYVGNTGISTGPHLHYEYRVHGKHVNPLTVKLPGYPVLSVDQLAMLKY